MLSEESRKSLEEYVDQLESILHVTGEDADRYRAIVRRHDERIEELRAEIYAIRTDLARA